jgi:hypothetical protein
MICVFYTKAVAVRPRLKRGGARAETRFFLSAKLTSPFKSAGASVQSITGSRGVRISGSNAGYIMFRGSVKSTDYPLHSPVPLHFLSRASPCAIRFQLDSTLLCTYMIADCSLWHTQHLHLGVPTFVLPTALFMKNQVFIIVTSCRLGNSFGRLGSACCLQFLCHHISFAV